MDSNGRRFCNVDGSKVRALWKSRLLLEIIKFLLQKDKNSKGLTRQELIQLRKLNKRA